MIGAIFGYHFMDTLAHRTILSIAGWRCIFVAFGLLSASVAGIGYFLLFDPRRGQVELEEPSESEQRTVIAEESVTFQGVTVADVLDGMKKGAYWALCLSMVLHDVTFVAFAYYLVHVRSAHAMHGHVTTVYTVGA